MKNARSTAAAPLAAAILMATTIGNTSALADDMPNACPVDGCIVELADATVEGGELNLTFDANFTPDMAKNHIHVWWGDNFSIKQVSNNAETVHGVAQGDWEPTDSYPQFLTSGVMSTGARGNATTICVSAADRNHDILDADVMHCVRVKSLL